MKESDGSSTIMHRCGLKLSIDDGRFINSVLIPTYCPSSIGGGGNCGLPRTSRVLSVVEGVYSGDGNFGYYPTGDATTLPAANVTGPASTGGTLYYGEYSPQYQEYCVDGNVVKYCGSVKYCVEGPITTICNFFYNVDKWEYCTEPTLGNFSVLRCAELQEPADRSLIDADNSPDVAESRCVCIANAEPLGEGQNGCKCKDGYRLSGGSCGW